MRTRTRISPTTQKMIAVALIKETRQPNFQTIPSHKNLQSSSVDKQIARVGKCVRRVAMVVDLSCTSSGIDSYQSVVCNN